jgi:hypothetical protein
MSKASLPIAIYHEHQDWFRPLFAELERRGTPYVRVDARAHTYDLAAREPEFSLLFNRMSPSAYLRGDFHGIYYTLSYLAHLERLGVKLINGRRGFLFETSKAAQLTLLESLGLAYPRSRVINHPSKAVEASEGLRFPVVVKANIGGSGAGIVKYDSREALADAVTAGQVDLGIDSTALVQEFTPARDGAVHRIEVVGGRVIYGIRIFSDEERFNLCPADVCQTTGGVELSRAACPVDAPKNGMRVEAYVTPPDVVEEVERIFAASAIDVGGVEFHVDDRDGSRRYYDINALSNFVAEGPTVVGFDPYVKLVEYLEREAR